MFYKVLPPLPTVCKMSEIKMGGCFQAFDGNGHVLPTVYMAFVAVGPMNAVDGDGNTISVAATQDVTPVNVLAGT